MNSALRSEGLRLDGLITSLLLGAVLVGDAAGPAAAQKSPTSQSQAEAQWIADVVDAIERRWYFAPTQKTGITGRFQCVARIHQTYKYGVSDVTIVKSCGHPAEDERLIEAIRRSSPLPLPDDPQIFHETLDVTFDEIAGQRKYRTLEEIQKVFDASKQRFFDLYKAKKPDESGKIEVSFTIDPSGEVVAAAIERSDFDDPAFEAEVLQRVRALRFENRKVATFSYPRYPIVFMPTPPKE